jgi:regulator of replication initiation timing
MKKEKSDHKNYIDMEVYLADIKRYRETAETQKMLLDRIMKENEELKKENATLQKKLDKYDTSLPF